MAKILYSVCAWCKSIMDEHGNIVKKLSDKNYDNMSKSDNVSHGICNECTEAAKHTEAAKRNKEGEQ